MPSKHLRLLKFEANITHRNISNRNIVIVDDKESAESPTGMLIDLDLALDLSQPQGERQLIGSDGFMAVGLLGGDDHTYRHDLESVFYVFLWTAICHDGSSSAQVPSNSRLNAWCGTDFLASFHPKMKDMDPEEFPIWTAEEFSQPFRPYLPLARLLHARLFPVRTGKFFIGTDIDYTAARELYQGVISAFEEYIGI